MKEIDKKIVETMAARRRDFHRYPETAWTEFRTTAKIAEALESLGYDLHFSSEFLRDEDVMGRNIDVKAEKARAAEQGADAGLLERMGEYTGLYADLDTGTPGPFTALRFDIDCVDTTETASEDHLPAREGFASVNPGRMHSCAHDGHTAIGLALAELLKEMNDERRLKGKIRLIFQPAEEGVRGGYAMMKAGVVDGVDYFLSLHLGLGTPTGTVYGGLDGFLCTTKVDADFKGVGAHPGMAPQNGKNALLAAATAALGLHAIAPHAGGTTRINVGVLNAGEGRNVIPPSAHMKIETRGENDELAAYIYDRAVQVVNGAAAMYDVEVHLTKRGEANAANSSPELASLVSEVAAAVPGVTSSDPEGPMSGSEDACWFMKRVQERGGQATYVGVGATTTAGHHNDAFDFDEGAMAIALEVLYRSVRKING